MVREKKYDIQITFMFTAKEEYQDILVVNTVIIRIMSIA